MNRTFSAVLLVVAGCGTIKHVHYADPAPQKIAAPMHVDLSDVSPPWKRDPIKVVDNDVLAPTSKGGVDKWFAAGGEKEPAPAEAPKTAQQVIREANEASSYEPQEGEAEGHTQVYVYDPDAMYRVWACPLEILQVRLAPGERLVTDPVFGNTGSKKSPHWSQVVEVAGDGHAKQIQFLLLRPNKETVPKQRMHLLTNVGPYEVELNVLPKGEDCMHGVRFRHPQHELNQLALEAEQTEAVTARVAAKSGNTCASANYDIEVTEGSPAWVPTMVWRACDGDRAQVNIQLPRKVALSKIPSLATCYGKCDKAGAVADYDYNPETKVIAVRGLFSQVMLSLGSSEVGYERVVIHALKESAQ